MRWFPCCWTRMLVAPFLVSCLAADEVQQIACKAISMRKKQAMCRPFIHLELAPLDCLCGPASTEVQGSALILIAMNDQGWHRTGRHLRSEVRLIRRPAELKDGFGRDIKNEPNHPLHHRRGQYLGSYGPCRSQTEVLDRATLNVQRAIGREHC